MFGIYTLLVTVGGTVGYKITNLQHIFDFFCKLNLNKSYRKEENERIARPYFPYVKNTY